MVILSQTTLQNSGNKSAHYLKHLLRDMFHTVWGHAPGNNRSAWGLGSWKEATLLHYLFLRLYVFLSLMDHFDWGRLEVNIWDAPMFKLFRNLPLTGIRISLLIHTPWQTPEDHHPTSQLQGRGPFQDTDTQGKGAHTELQRIFFSFS